MATLIIVWNDGSKEEHGYPTYAEARQAEIGLHKAFGSQLWTAIQ